MKITGNSGGLYILAVQVDFPGKKNRQFGEKKL